MKINKMLSVRKIMKEQKAKSKEQEERVELILSELKKAEIEDREVDEVFIESLINHLDIIERRAEQN